MAILPIHMWALSHLQNYKLSFRSSDHAVKRIVEIIDQRLRAKAARSLGLTQLPADSTRNPAELLCRPILKEEVHRAAA
jgi:hypothetical protein